MYERMTLMLGRLMTVRAEDLKREDGQGATEYAMVIGFVIVGLSLTLLALGTGITNFLTAVGNKLTALGLSLP